MTFSSDLDMYCGFSTKSRCFCWCLFVSWFVYFYFFFSFLFSRINSFCLNVVHLRHTHSGESSIQSSTFTSSFSLFSVALALSPPPSQSQTTPNLMNYTKAHSIRFLFLRSVGVCLSFFYAFRGFQCLFLLFIDVRSHDTHAQFVCVRFILYLRCLRLLINIEWKIHQH